jgi:hypothetical protein
MALYCLIAQALAAVPEAPVALCALGTRPCLGPIAEVWQASSNCSGVSSYNSELLIAEYASAGQAVCVNSSVVVASKRFICDGNQGLVEETFSQFDCLGPATVSIRTINQCFSQTQEGGYTTSFINRCLPTQANTSFIHTQTQGEPIHDNPLSLGNTECPSPNNCSVGTPYVTHYNTSINCTVGVGINATNSSHSNEIYRDLELNTCYEDTTSNKNVLYQCVAGVLTSFSYTRGCNTTAFATTKIPISQCFIDSSQVDSSYVYHCDGQETPSLVPHVPVYSPPFVDGQPGVSQPSAVSSIHETSVFIIVMSVLVSPLLLTMHYFYRYCM